MDFCFSKHALGVSANITLSNNNYIVSEHVPENSWVVGEPNHVLCAETLCKIYGKPIPKLYTESEKKTFEILGKNPSTVPWLHVLGLETVKKRMLVISRHLEAVLGESTKEVYNNIYVDTRKLLCSLSPAHICEKTLNKFLAMEKNSSLKTCLGTFRPDSGNSTKQIIYNQTGTTTGRLTVKSGPSILTLPARYRPVIKSRFPKGKILSIDFKSLEPRVALAVRSKSAPDDIYTYIANNILKGSITRDVAKLATIAALYGISFKKFREMSKCHNREVLDSVKDFFSVKALSKNLLEGEFKNFWGRPLDSNTMPHVRISHFVQSTSCDLVNIGFWKFLADLEAENILSIPIFVLHDALILDVPEESVARIEKACFDGIDTLLGNFPITCEKF